MDLSRPERPRRAAFSALAALFGTFVTLAVLCMNDRRPEGGRAVRTDCDGMPVSLGECVHLGSVVNGRLLDFSPDGTTLAVAAAGSWTSAGPIRLWDLRSRTEMRPFGEGCGELESIRFSPDSSLLVAHDKREGVRVWKVGTGEQLDAFKPPTIYDNWVGVYFSPDCTSLLVKHYGENFPNDALYKIRDIGVGRDRASIPAESWLFSFSPDRSRAATLTTGPGGKRTRVMLWDWGARRVPLLRRDHAVRADGVAFSHDLAYFATVNHAGQAGETSELRIVGMDTGVTRLSFTHTDDETHIQEINFSRAGNLLIANGGGGSQLFWKTRSTVWDITGGRPEAWGATRSSPQCLRTGGSWLCATNRPCCRTRIARSRWAASRSCG
jgi:WD40 repeat protein